MNTKYLELDWNPSEKLSIPLTTSPENEIQFWVKRPEGVQKVHHRNIGCVLTDLQKTGAANDRAPVCI